jgi:hypothetical protein
MGSFVNSEGAFSLFPPIGWMLIEGILGHAGQHQSGVKEEFIPEMGVITQAIKFFGGDPCHGGGVSEFSRTGGDGIEIGKGVILHNDSPGGNGYSRHAVQFAEGEHVTRHPIVKLGSD